MSVETTISQEAFCDFNHATPTVAAYDGKTVIGPWAYMCEAHFALYGVGLGTGKGQRLIVAGADR